MAEASTLAERLEARIEAVLPTEYHSATELVDESQRRLLALMFDGVPDELDPLVTGKITGEWLAAVVEVDGKKALVECQRTALGNLLARAQARVGDIRRSVNEKILTAHNVELQDLLVAAAALAESLDGVESADDAITKGKADEWKQLRSYVDDYAVLRRSQMSYTPDDLKLPARPIQPGEEEHSSDLYLANLDEIWPEWRNPDRRSHINLGGPAHRYEPWPADPNLLLLWLATSDANPWVPTRADIDQLTITRRTPSDPATGTRRAARDHPVRTSGGWPMTTTLMNRPIMPAIKSNQ